MSVEQNKTSVSIFVVDQLFVGIANQSLKKNNAVFANFRGYP